MADKWGRVQIRFSNDQIAYLEAIVDQMMLGPRRPDASINEAARLCVDSCMTRVMDPHVKAAVRHLAEVEKKNA